MSREAQKTHRVTAKEGAKTEYAQAYTDFMREESASLQTLTGLKSDIVLLTSYDHKFDVYPDTAESLKEVSDYKNRMNFYRLNRQMSVFTCFRVTSNMTAIEEAWNISFDKTNETVMAYKESRSENGPRDAEVTISGKAFKRYDGIVLAILTMEKLTQTVKLHLVDPASGSILSSKRIAEKLPAKVPLLNVYDNAVLVGLHYEKPQPDEIVLTELFIAPEMAGTEHRGDVKKASLAELVYPVTTGVVLEWKIYGLQMAKANAVEYIVSVDEENNLRTVEVAKLERSKQEKAGENNSKKVKLADGLKFRAPVTIEYNHAKKNMMIHGLDMYSFQFP